MASNTVRDIALSVGAASLMTFAILFGVTQCSGDEKIVEKNDKKSPKIEVVNNNKVVTNGNANVKNNTKVVVGDAIVVENNNEVIVDNRRNCGKDTLVVKVIDDKKQPVKKSKPVQPVVRDTVYVPVEPQDTTKKAVEPTYSISAVHICVRNNSMCR